MLLSASVFGSTAYVSSSGPCGPKTPYGSIQEAVDAASSGDTIVVCSGAGYYENVLINKRIALLGNGSSGKAVIMAAMASKPVLISAADGVVISDFLLSGSSGSCGLQSISSRGKFSNLESYGNDIGFCLQSSTNNQLLDNIAHDNFDEGFRLTSGSDGNDLTGNVAYNQFYYGFYVQDSSNNYFGSNTAYNSTGWYGFFLYSGARHNTLEGNEAYMNGHSGFSVYMGTDNEIIGNSAFGNSAEGFRLSSASGNLLERNNASNNLAEGFRLSSSNRNTLKDNTAENNRDGILVFSGSDNTLEGNLAQNNSRFGFYIHSSSGNRITENEAKGQNNGFYLFGASKNQLDSNKAYGNENGFYLDLSSDNRLSSNEAKGNNAHGFLFSSSSDNQMNGNVAEGNVQYGLYVYMGSNNSLSENLAENNSAGIVLYSASENRISGGTANSNANDGIYLYLSSANDITGNTASENLRHGIYLYESDSNQIKENLAYGNHASGIEVYLGSDNSLKNNDARENQDGFAILSGTGNEIKDSTAESNTRYGFFIKGGSDNVMKDNSAKLNSVAGMRIESASTVEMKESRFYGNGLDLELATSSSPMDLDIREILFDSPSGNGENHTSLSILDQVEPYTAYSLKWTTRPDELPHPYISFNNMYLQISGDSSIDRIIWHWNEEESVGYRESDLDVWQYDMQGWIIIGSDLNESNNSVSVSGLEPASVYALLQNRTPPSIILQSPESGAIETDPNVTLAWTVESMDPAAWCDVILNNVGITSSSLTVTPGLTTSMEVLLSSESQQNWSVICSDTVGTNSNSSSFVFDRPPVVHLNDPGEEHVNSSSYSLYFTADDNLSATLSCKLLLDRNVFLTNNSVKSSQQSAFKVSGLSEGSHALSVLCQDGSGNNGSSENKDLISDYTPPSLTIVSPPDGYYGNDTSLNFTFAANDSLSPNITYTLFIDNRTAANGSSENVTAPVTPGNHTWSVIAYDGADNSNQSENRSFTIDRISPVVTVLSPIPARIVLQSVPSGYQIVYTASDDLDPLLECELLKNGTSIASNNSVQNNQASSFMLPSLLPGSHLIAIRCFDSAGNSGTSSSKTFVIDPSSPTVILLSPVAGYLGNSSNVTFSSNASDNYSSIVNCSLILDGSVRQTGSGSVFSYSVASGQHNWSVNCTDEAGNIGHSVTRNFSLDLSPPSITLQAPQNGESILSNSSVIANFSFTATDDSSTPLFCAMYYDNDVEFTNGSVANNALVSHSINVSLGAHQWYVICKDQAGNWVHSTTRTITVRSSNTNPGGGGGDEDPKITINYDQECPGNVLKVTPSRGSGTLIKLLDENSLLVESKVAGNEGFAEFTLSISGDYTIRASKPGYRQTSVLLDYTACNEGDPNQSSNQTSGQTSNQSYNQSSSPIPGGTSGIVIQPTKPPASTGSGVSSQVNTVPEGVIAHTINLTANETVRVNDTVSVEVYIDGEPAAIWLGYTSPDGATRLIKSNSSGQAEFVALQVGDCLVFTAQDGIPYANSTVVVTNVPETGLLPWLGFGYSFSICTPITMFLLLLLLMLVYLATRRRKKEDKRYKGYGKGSEKTMSFF